MSFFKSILTVLFIITYQTTLFGQVEKGSWEVGLIAAPIIELEVESDINPNGGIYLAGIVGYSPVNKLFCGLTPYYSYLTHENFYSFNPVTQKPYGTREFETISFGINLNVKYDFIKAKRLIYYISVSAGIGTSTRFIEYGPAGPNNPPHNSVNKDFIINLIGEIGARIAISKTIDLELGFAYQLITETDYNRQSRYIFPSIGIMKVLK